MIWRPSVDTLFFVLINSILGSSPDLHNHHHIAPSTISNSGGFLGSDPYLVGGSGLSKVKLDEPGLESWFVN